MVYGWDEHKDVCYRLYIEERRPLEEIIQHMRDTYNFAPSKRAYQTQFRRWDFPSKQHPAHRNVDLVTRVKELWEQNLTQRAMLDVLKSEGYEIKQRELMRVRAKNRWLLRTPNGAKQEQILHSAEGPEDGLEETHHPLQDESLQKQKERHHQLQAESDERWASKKRRRRTRDYAGISADPPGPPRFPSETTLDEGKQMLGLHRQQYRELRIQFQEICEQEGVIKKTIAGPEKWQDVKDRLIRENSVLQTTMWSDGLNSKTKELALDVICTDVTKRMRTTEKRMTIADAKNALGINPEQSREIRDAFYRILQGFQFTSKLETGAELWQELKDLWMSQTPLLQQILVPGDPDHPTKLMALEILCRDVMKRLRDNGARKKKTGSTEMLTDIQSPRAQPSSLQIDPSLLEPAQTLATPTAVYIRPHPKSQIYASAKMWLTSLRSRRVQELKDILANKWSNAKPVRIDAVEKDHEGREISYLIEEDEELDAYLDHVEGRKAIFVVLLKQKH